MRSHKSGNIQGENLHIYYYYLGHIGLQNMKVEEKANFGRLATIFQICSMDADILS